MPYICRSAAALLLMIGAAQASSYPSVANCGEEPGVYRSANSRHAWMLRSGLIERKHKPAPYLVAEVIFDDGGRALLHGVDPMRWRITEDSKALEQQRGRVLWQAWDRLPAMFGLAGDDGSTGPLFEFSQCGQNDTPAIRTERKEFWE